MLIGFGREFGTQHLELWFVRGSRENIHMPANKPKRVRNDSFSGMSEEEIANKVDEIIAGISNVHHINFYAHIKWDAHRRVQCCWALRNKKKRLGVLFGAGAYKSFLIWQLFYDPDMYMDAKKVRKVRSALAKVRRSGTGNYHHTHRCGNNWCCNPDHLRLATSRKNEHDKAYHFFLNNIRTRGRFMKAMRPEIKNQGVW